MAVGQTSLPSHRHTGMLLRPQDRGGPSSRGAPFLLVATANTTFMANENATVLACCFVRSRAAVVMKSPRMERGRDVRMGDQDVAEALSRTGRFAVGAGAAVRDRPHDDLALGQDWAAGPGPVGRFERILAAPPVMRKLDPYKAIIDARLEEFPKLSAKRLFDETRAAGYPGCYEGVRNYVRVARPRAPVEPTVRFETPAGRQGQMDFGTFTLPWGRLLKAPPDPAPRHPACGKELAPELLHFHLPDGVRPFGWTIQPALFADRLRTSLRDAAMATCHLNYSASSATSPPAARNRPKLPRNVRGMEPNTQTSINAMIRLGFRHFRASRSARPNH